ncbi:MAG: CAP domain-containing protein [Patescibacteria group bacterium]|nr:CAP domain-containing protein [Patescibacteria group bacterium]
MRLILLSLLIILVCAGVQFYDLHIQIPRTVDQSNSIDNLPGAGIIRNVEPAADSNETPNTEFFGTLDGIISLANEARKEKGLSLLQRNEKLMESALLKANDMKNNNYFEHVSPDGLQPWFFVEQANYTYKTVGENLAEGYFSAQSVHDAWMGSKGHRKNILSSDFENIGVAVVEIENEGRKSFLSVQHFGSMLKQEDLKTITVCDLESKNNCEHIEKKKKETKEAISEQEKIIKKAKKAGASAEDLHDLYKNLEKLKRIKRELKDYLNECAVFIEKCDKWR